LRIAFVSQPLDGVVPPQQSSIGIWTYQVARRLAVSHDVMVYAKRMRGQPSPGDTRGVRYRFVPAVPNQALLRLSGLAAGRRGARRPLFAEVIYNLEYSLQVARDVRKQQCDIIHIHNFSQFVPVIRALNPSAKIVLHMHCEWLSQLDRPLVEARLRRADLVIGCSEHITGKVRRRFPERAGRCQTVFNGVDVDHFVGREKPGPAPNGAPHLLFVGRVSPEKGLHVLLEAFRDVVRVYPEARLQIVGSAGSAPLEFLAALSEESRVSDLARFYRGSYLSYLHSLLPPPTSGQVIYRGPVPHSEIAEVYQGADVLINPSLSEAFGMSLIEAMASQVPVVATRVGGMPGIVEDGKTGLLVEPQNPRALAAAVLELAGDRGLRKSMGEAGRRRVIELFSWGRVVQTLLGHYKNLL
jgi:glycosyltransferase involved in cell wall biosynthesis